MGAEHDLGVPPTLRTERLVLEPLGPAHLDGVWAALQDPEAIRLTGTHATFTRERIEQWLSALAGRDDRLDWAITAAADGAYLGEVVLNDLDADNGGISFRIALVDAGARDRGIGTEATRAVVTHAFDVVGVHRIELEVYAFNPRARRVYEKVGFVLEGVRRDALRWEGEWIDAALMSMLATDPRG